MVDRERGRKTQDLWRRLHEQNPTVFTEELWNRYTVYHQLGPGWVDLTEHQLVQFEKFLQSLAENSEMQELAAVLLNGRG